MATGVGVNQGKTAFVEEYLASNPDARLDGVNEAWKAAGHEGSVSDSLVNKARAKLKLTGKKRYEAVGTEVASSAPAKGKSKSIQPKTRKPAKAAESRGVFKSEPRPGAAKPEPANGPAEVAHANGNGNRLSPDLFAGKPHHGDDQGRELHRIEAEIDELVFRLRGLGGFAEVQEALRAARRLLVRSHQG